MPAYPVLLLALLLWAHESRFKVRHPAWTRLAYGCAVAIALAGFGSPLVEALPQGRGAAWSGWRELAAAAERWKTVIDDANGGEGNVFFFTLDYRDAAQLWRNLVPVHARLEPGGLLE